jgi:hypothetical protein
MTAGGTLIDGGALTINNGSTSDFVTAGTGTIEIAGSFTNAETFTAGTGTVVYDGTSAQTALSTTYYNLTTSNSAGVTLGGTSTVGGDNLRRAVVRQFSERGLHGKHRDHHRCGTADQYDGLERPDHQ